MADEKVTFEISADTKEAQKELEALQKDLKDVVNITDGKCCQGKTCYNIEYRMLF